MITNYPTFRIKAHLKIMFTRCFNDLPLDPRKETIIILYLVLKVFSLIMHMQGFQSFASF